jgi:hypothetical protein
LDGEGRGRESTWFYRRPDQGDGVPEFGGKHFEVAKKEKRREESGA